MRTKKGEYKGQAVSDQKSVISFCERFRSNNHESDVHNYVTIQLFG
jgi:hypothetical protein